MRRALGVSAPDLASKPHVCMLPLGHTAWRSPHRALLLPIAHSASESRDRAHSVRSIISSPTRGATTRRTNGWRCSGYAQRSSSRMAVSQSYVRTVARSPTHIFDAMPPSSFPAALNFTGRSIYKESVPRCSSEQGLTSFASIRIRSRWEYGVCRSTWWRAHNSSYCSVLRSQRAVGACSNYLSSTPFRCDPGLLCAGRVGPLFASRRFDSVPVSSPPSL